MDVHWFGKWNLCRLLCYPSINPFPCHPFQARVLVIGPHFFHFTHESISMREATNRKCKYGSGMLFKKTACQSFSFSSYSLRLIYPTWGFMCMSRNIGTDWNKAFHPISLQISSNSAGWLGQNSPRSLHQFTLGYLLNFRYIEYLTTCHCLKLKKTAPRVSRAPGSLLPLPQIVMVFLLFCLSVWLFLCHVVEFC